MRKVWAKQYTRFALQLLLPGVTDGRLVECIIFDPGSVEPHMTQQFYVVDGLVNFEVYVGICGTWRIHWILRAPDGGSHGISECVEVIPEEEINSVLHNPKRLAQVIENAGEVLEPPPDIELRISDPSLSEELLELAQVEVEIPAEPEPVGAFASEEARHAYYYGIPETVGVIK